MMSSLHSDCPGTQSASVLHCFRILLFLTAHVRMISANTRRMANMRKMIPEDTPATTLEDPVARDSGEDISNN